MRITEAAQRLGTSPRMLRYRESLGLLPAVRGRLPARHPAHRQFGADDLSAVALGLAIEHRYDVTPAALAFGLRVLAEPAIRAEVAELGRRIGRIPAPPSAPWTSSRNGRSACWSCRRPAHPGAAPPLPPPPVRPPAGWPLAGPAAADYAQGGPAAAWREPPGGPHRRIGQVRA